jgi:hypothetical protein
LILGENNYKNLDQKETSEKQDSAGYRLDEKGDQTTMAAVLIGPKEVLVIIIITVVVVFLVMVRRRKH